MKNKIILLNFLPTVDSTYRIKRSIYQSTDSLLIGTLLKNIGYAVELIDGAYYENYIDILKDVITSDKEQILFVGMSVMITQIPMALKASKLIRVCV